MKYYLHDSNAFNDEKITRLYIKYGYEGLGLFYTTLEKFAAQEKPILTDVVKKQLGIKKRLNKVWSFMEEIGIISSSNGESFNKELLKFSEKYQIKKEKNAKRVADFRARQENVMHYERISNAPKVKLSKVNISKDTEKQFLEFWNKYPKKISKKSALKAFLNISPNDDLLEKILRGVEAQSKTEAWQKEDGKFIPHPVTWLNQERWNDEVKNGTSIFRPFKISV